MSFLLSQAVHAIQANPNLYDVNDQIIARVNGAPPAPYMNQLQR